MVGVQFRNKLLQKMAPGDLAGLAPHLERVETPKRQVLLRRNDIVDHVYFVESGHLSVLAKTPDSCPIEVAMIGREGMTDFIRSGRSVCETIVQMDGEAIRIRRTDLVASVRSSITLALLFMMYQQAFASQVAFTALSHGAYTLRERLSRYILMADDRADGRDLPFVHDFFSWMLAVRRSGVTECMNRLASDGAVETARGRVRVIDREKLKQVARGSYGQSEAEYERLFAEA